jgi:hypothetical protein
VGGSAPSILTTASVTCPRVLCVCVCLCVCMCVCVCNVCLCAGTNILFPNVSTNSNHAALFSEPVLHINSRIYAAASPNQFCIYPCPYMSVLLLRRVLLPGLNSFGPVFWASTTVPPG